MACRAVLAAQVPSPNQNPATIPRVPILQVWIGKDRRRTFPAPTESNIEALEFADGTDHGRKWMSATGLDVFDKTLQGWTR
jgi:hypothetical protein